MGHRQKRVSDGRVWSVGLQAADIDGLIADEEDAFEPAAAFVERHAPVPKGSTKVRRQESEHKPAIGYLPVHL